MCSYTEIQSVTELHESRSLRHDPALFTNPKTPSSPISLQNSINFLLFQPIHRDIHSRDTRPSPRPDILRAAMARPDQVAKLALKNVATPNETVDSTTTYLAANRVDTVVEDESERTKLRVYSIGLNRLKGSSHHPRQLAYLPVNGNKTLVIYRVEMGRGMSYTCESLLRQSRCSYARDRMRRRNRRAMSLRRPWTRSSTVVWPQSYLSRLSHAALYIRTLEGANAINESSRQRVTISSASLPKASPACALDQWLGCCECPTGENDPSRLFVGKKKEIPPRRVRPIRSITPALG